MKIAKEQISAMAPTRLLLKDSLHGQVLSQGSVLLPLHIYAAVSHAGLARSMLRQEVALIGEVDRNCSSPVTCLGKDFVLVFRGLILLKVTY